MAVGGAIEVHELSKSYADLQAVKQVSFSVERGEILSLLGPNGAGKSTVIAMLCCLTGPTGGEAWVMGHSILNEPMRVKACIGVVPQEVSLYPDLSARDNLAFWGKMQGLHGGALWRRVDEVLGTIGLEARQRGAVAKFSGGMKRRVNIGIALMHRPEVLILDEPTVGIDPQSRRHILDSIMALKRSGTTVLYTTHYMEEAQEISGRIAIMDQGAVVAVGAHAELVQMVGELDRVELTLSGEAAAVLRAWERTEGVRRISAVDGRLSLLVEDGNRVLPRLFEAAGRGNARITSVRIQEPDLEAVFLHLTGRALRDA